MFRPRLYVQMFSVTIVVGIKASTSLAAEQRTNRRRYFFYFFFYAERDSEISTSRNIEYLKRAKGGV